MGRALGWAKRASFAGLLACLVFAAAWAQEQAPVEPGEGDTQRQRVEWFFQQRAYPQGFIPSAARVEAIGQFNRMQQMLREQRLRRQAAGQGESTDIDPLAAWTFIGPQPTNTPFNVPVESGRVSALAVDPRDASVVYAGTANGGVWKTTDGGLHWTALTDTQPSLSVGSIALDPNNPDTVYAGTGDLTSFYGAGILKSTDAGQTWTNIPGPFVGPFDTDQFFGASARIISLAVHPSNSQIVLASAWRWPLNQAGIFRSTDAGATWTQVLAGPGSDVMFDPSNGNIAYAAIGNYYGFASSGVYKSGDAGATWTLDDGSGANVLPPQNQIGVIRLALAPSQTSRLYTFILQQGTFPGVPLGLFKTTDGGANWTKMPNPPATCCTPLLVHPANADVIFGGGAFIPSPLFRSLDGAQSWSDVSVSPNGNHLHADTRSMAFFRDGSRIYVGNDGGVDTTTNSTTSPVSWTNLDATLAITTFYPGLWIAPANINLAYAGAQDTGTQKYTGTLTWNELQPCGDGGPTALDFNTPTTVYATCQNIDVWKSTNSGVSGSWSRVITGINTADRVSFIPPLAMDPSNSQTLYFATFRVYQTRNGAGSWTAISPDLTGGSFKTLTTIAVAPSDSRTVYAGALVRDATDTRVSITTNADAGAGATWTNISAGLPPRTVTQIAVDPTNAQTAYVTFSGFSGFFGDTQGHVFNWTDISGSDPNALPNIPANDIVIDPAASGTIYVATDAGVYFTTDGGNNWAPLGTGLPLTQVLALKLHAATRTLRAASFGRSAWEFALAAAGPAVTLSPTSLTFPDQVVGTTSEPLSVTLTNSGTATLNIASITLAGANPGDYAFDSSTTCPLTGGSVDPGGNCVFAVTFTPTATGARPAQVSIADNAPGSPQTVPLSGNGIAGAPAVSLMPASLDLGMQPVGTTSDPQMVMLTNTGTATLNITSIVLGGAVPGDYAFDPSTTCPLSGGQVAAGDTCVIAVTFTPSDVGTRAAQVNISDNAAGSPQTVPLTGVGTAAMSALANLPALSLL